MANLTNFNKGALEAGFSLGATPSYRRRGELAGVQDSSQQLANAMRASKLEAETALLNDRRKNMATAPQEFLSAVTGLNQNQLSELSQAMLSGWAMQRDQGPPTAAGQEPLISTKPEWVTPNVEQRFNTGRSALALGNAATGDSNADQLARAFTQMSGNMREEAALGGSTSPQSLAQVMAASAGKPMRDVTSSGIDFDPYAKPGTAISTEPFDMANAMKNAAGIEQAKIRAQGGVDEAAVRMKEGNKLPAQAALIEYYRSLGMPTDQAIETANSRKNVSVRDLALEQYQKAFQAAMFDTNGDEEKSKQIAEDAANSAVDYLVRNAGKFGGAKPAAQESKSAGYSQEDLEYTAKKHGISVEEVKKRLGVE